MNKEIKVGELLSLKDKFYSCGVEPTKFEKEFVNSIIENAKYLNKGKKIFGDIEDLYNRDIVLILSDKQANVLDGIRIRYKNAYNNRCSYYIYKQVIKDYEIKLEQFDKDTLESFKGEKETEESKEWLRQIILYR